MRMLHIGLRVGDRRRSIDFYQALGFEIVGQVPGTPEGDLTMLKLPDDEFISLELVANSPRGTAEPNGINHLVIHTPSLERTRRALGERGIDVPGGPTPDPDDEVHVAWLTDPDGYRIELVQWPAGHPDGMTAADFEGAP